MTRKLTDEAKRLRGTLRKQAARLALPFCVPQPPADLTEPELACWHELVGNLGALGSLSQVDGLLIAAAARCGAAVTDLQRDVRDNGRTYETTTPTGAVMQRTRPQVAILRTAERDWLRYLGELGLTPAGRIRFPGSEPAQRLPTAPRKLTGTADDYFVD